MASGPAWLLLGLAGALLSAGLVGAFEQKLAANVVLAFFVPGIVHMADAVGTQTETLVIRGRSVGVPIRHVGQTRAPYRSPGGLGSISWTPRSGAVRWQP